MKPYFSKYYIDKILDTAIVLVDTREQENKHVLDFLTTKSIAFRVEKLDYGDYALVIPKNETYGIMYEMRTSVAVERKADLEEVSGNFSDGRTPFEEELWRGVGNIVVVVENGSLGDIIKKHYNTQYNSHAFLATLLSFERRYDVNFHFATKETSGAIIYAILRYGAREELLK